MKEAAENGIDNEGKTYLVKPCFPVDMSCHWKVTGMGGACKVTSLFCHLCVCTSNNCAKYKTGTRRCDDCIADGEEFCFHYKIDDDDEISKKKTKVVSLLQKYPHLQDLPNCKPSHPMLLFQCDPTVANKKNSPTHTGENRFFINS